MDSIYRLDPDDSITRYTEYNSADLSNYTDDELMDMPAHILGDAIRRAAMGGKKLVISDPVCTSNAAVRVGADVANELDYKPHLDWSYTTTHPQYLPDTYEVNMSTVNATIPPRVTTPALPDQTKLSSFEALNNEVTLSAVENCIIRGFTSIQVQQKAGGDVTELVKLLNKAWGGTHVFDMALNYDFLGDITLARYLARAGKHRFQLYRNIGWLEIVNAGQSNAMANNYGYGAVINWQRRTELAKYYLHIAMILEGSPIPHESEYQIYVRIPDFSVQYLSWTECALHIDSQDVTEANIPNEFSDIAESLVRSKKGDFLFKLAAVVNKVTSSGFLKREEFDIINKFEKLVFVAPLNVISIKPEASINRMSEIARSKPIGITQHKPAVSKSHDVPTAFIEALFSAVKDELDTESITNAAILKEVIEIGSVMDKNERIKMCYMLENNYHQYDVYTKAIYDTLNLPKSVKMKARWEKLLQWNIPDELMDPSNYFRSFVRIIYYILITMETSKSRSTLKHWNAQINKQLYAGIRTQQELTKIQGSDVMNTVMSSISVSNKHVFNCRYRARGKMYKSVIPCMNTKERSKAMMIKSAIWYAKADILHYFAPSYVNGVMELHLDEAMYKKTMFVLASAMKLQIKPPLLQKQTIDSIRDTLDNWYESNKPVSTITDDLVFNKFSLWVIKYRDLHLKDYIDVALPVVETKPQVRVELPRFAITSKDFVMNNLTIDGAVRNVFKLAPSANFAEPDELDELAEYWTKKIAGDELREKGFIDTYYYMTDREKAEEVFNKWYAILTGEANADSKEVM